MLNRPGNSTRHRDLIDSGQGANRRQSNIHEIIAIEVTAANALGSPAFLRSLWMSSARKRSPVSTKPAASANINREETPFEALASICSVLVVGMFILTFLAQNYVIPSGSMKNTLLVGDHLVVDQITLMAPRFVDAANQVSRAQARRYRGVPQARLSTRY